jgi:hypothetical protein
MTKKPVKKKKDKMPSARELGKNVRQLIMFCLYAISFSLFIILIFVLFSALVTDEYLMWLVGFWTLCCLPCLIAFVVIAVAIILLFLAVILHQDKQEGKDGKESS